MFFDSILHKKIILILFGTLTIPLLFASVYAVSNTISVSGQDVKYNIENAQISSIKLEPTFLEILIDFISTGDGFIEINIPRTLLDAKASEAQDDIFFVLVDGFETEYIEIASNTESRTIVIPFFKGDTHAEIIGTEALKAPVNEIPKWIKNNAGWWYEGKIGDADFVSGIQYLITKGIISV